MQYSSLQLLYRVVLPPILGGTGAIVAATAPAYYQAVCGSPMLPLAGGF